MLTDRPLCLVSCSWDAGCTEAGGGAAASSSRRAENSRDLTSVRWTELDLLPSPLVVVVFFPPPTLSGDITAQISLLLMEMNRCYQAHFN